MTPFRRAGHQRPARAGRRALVAAGAALTLLPLGGVASAQSFIDPEDPCLGNPPPASFADREQIPEVHVRNVDCAAFNEIVKGRTVNGQNVYQPGAPVRRDQMASFIARTLEAGGYDLPAPEPDPFADTDGNVHEDAISQLKQIGVVEGTGGGNYSPDRIVPRDQMTAFLIRATAYAFSDTPQAIIAAVVELPGFTDVAADNPFRGSIAASVRLFGLAEGVTETMYVPAKGTNRDQMATFVTRLLDVTLIPEPTGGDNPGVGLPPLDLTGNTESLPIG